MARSPTTDGVVVEFEELWRARRSQTIAPDVLIALPDMAGLILTKRIAARPKDLEDIRLLEVLRREEQS